MRDVGRKTGTALNAECPRFDSPALDEHLRTLKLGNSVKMCPNGPIWNRTKITYSFYEQLPQATSCGICGSYISSGAGFSPRTSGFLLSLSFYHRS